MGKSNKDEINIIDILNSSKIGLIKFVSLLFKALDFIIKKWIIITILFAAGLIAGYYSQKNSKPNKETKVIIRINHDAVSYVYNEVEILNEKIKENDRSFFKEKGFDNGDIYLKNLEITPIVDLMDISKSYDVNDRNLEGLLRNIEFNNDEINIPETFTSKYKYHNLDIKLSNKATLETINILIASLNRNEILERLKDTTINNIKNHIALNNNSIVQINKIINNYTTKGSLPSFSDQIYVVDKNFSIHGLLLKKSELQEETEKLNKYLVYADEIVLVVNKPSIITEKPGLFGNKLFSYPFYFVFCFLFLSFFRYFYNYLRDITEQYKIHN